jgi:hypothetical protein
MPRPINFSIKPREGQRGFNIISEELGFVIPCETLDFALSYARRKADSRALRIDILGANGELVEEIEYGSWEGDALI